MERAIGLIYLPETERISHYFHTRLPDQFDAVLHFDATQPRAVEPLERTAQWQPGEPWRNDEAVFVRRQAHLSSINTIWTTLRL
ncbi:MAG: erythromycin esterase family protein [Gammaproteobacteria bacterium]